MHSRFPWASKGKDSIHDDPLYNRLRLGGSSMSSRRDRRKEKEPEFYQQLKNDKADGIRYLRDEKVALIVR